MENENVSLNDMLKNMGHETKVEVIEGEFVGPEEQVEESKPPEKREHVRMAVAGGIAFLVACPVIFLLATTGTKFTPTAKNQSGGGNEEVSSAAKDKEKLLDELNTAKTNAWMQSQKDKEKEAQQASPSPSISASPSATASPSPAITKQPAKLSPKEDTTSASSQKIAQLEGQIARLEKQLAQKQESPRMQTVARSAPIRSQQPTIARASTPQPKAQPTQIAKATPSPSASPQPKAQPTQIAKAPAATTSEKKASWDEIASAGSYGGTEQPKTQGAGGKGVEAEPSAGAMRLPVGVSVAGHTAGPIAMLVNSNTQGVQKTGNVLSVSIDQPIQVSGGWSLPIGSVIEFAIVTDESGLIQGTSKKVFIGNDEIKMPEGTFGISTPAGEPLMAKVSQPNGDRLAEADTSGAIWGGLTEAGKALARAGDTNTVSNSGLGATVTTVNNPNPNILGAAGSGVFGVLSKRNTDRAEAMNKRLEKQGYVATLPPQTKVQIHVLQAAAFNPPGGYAADPPPAPPTANETDRDVQQQVSAKQRQMATTLTPINEQKPPQELPESLRGLD